MLLRIGFFIYKLRSLYIGIAAVVGCFLILWLALAILGPLPAQPAVASNTPVDATALGMSESPNAVTAALSTAVLKTEQALDSTVRTIASGMQRVATATTQTGKQLQKGTIAAVRGVGSGTVFLSRAVGRGVSYEVRSMGVSILFVLRVPASVFGYVAHASVVSAVIKPADHAAVPIIDPQSPIVISAKEALPAAVPPADPAAPPVEPQAIWPLHGQITTQFGVPEWPYQAVHTGLDISDGARSGVTPIHAYRQGKVIGTEHTGGLGNHVIIDHGSGVTSVYGHLASIAVTIGQEVDTNTVVGYEGTTGVSTGPHLHFEIRVNGQATDPHQFISGQPY